MWSVQSPWHFVSKMSVELTGGDMSLIVLALDSEIELQKRKLERLGIVDDARDNEKKIRLNREKSYARRWMDENEKEMGWRVNFAIQSNEDETSESCYLIHFRK